MPFFLLRNHVAHIDAHLWANFASDAFLLQKAVLSSRAEREKEPLRISSANVFLVKLRAEKLARYHFVCLIALNEKFSGAVPFQCFDFHNLLSLQKPENVQHEP